jgi:glyoxylase-like metal-dependent hydrolase (beta-lactamase superfamily II)
MKKGHTWNLHVLLAGEFGPMPEWMRIRQAGVDPGKNIPSYIYLLQNDNLNILVDTSFSNQQDVTEKMGIYCKREKSISGLLNDFDTSIEEINMVILTHLHWDHAGNFDLFPNAVVFCQEEEYQWMCRTRTWEIGYPDWFAERLLKSPDRFRFLDGDYDAAPGLYIWKFGGHTPGSQMVGFETGNGMGIIPGDNVMSYENVEQNIPIGLMCDIRMCMASIEKIQKDAEMYVPSHDWRSIGKKE